MSSQASADEPTKQSEAYPRLKFSLAVDHLFGSLGLFSLLPILGVLLASRSAEGTAVVGFGLFCYTASAGLSALLVTRLLSKVDYRTGMVGSVLLSAIAFGLLPYVDGAWALCGLLLLAGLGVSIHFVLGRVLIAEIVSDNIGRNDIFSVLQIMVNAAAAVGPFVAGFLYSNTDTRLLLGIVSAAYVVAGLSILPGVPSNLKPPPASSRWPIGAETLRAIRRNAVIRRTAVIGTLGAFIYAQFFSGFALLVAHSFASPGLRATLLAGPAVLIVLFQTVITGVVRRMMNRGTTPFAVLVYATLVFGIAMLILGGGLPVIIAAAGAVLVFSVAEMLFTPMMSTAFAALPIESKLEAFNLRQVCWTSGEALGSLAGGSLFLAMYQEGNAQLYWLALSAVAFIVIAALLPAVRRGSVSA